MTFLSGLALLASMGMTTMSSAAPVPEDGPGATELRCFAEDANNNRVWQEHRTDLRGLANWEEDGDKLVVIDDEGYGSTAARLEICYDNKWVYKGYYADSWVNGWETYDFDFQEKRKVRFYVCKKQDGEYTHCGEWKYGNAQTRPSCIVRDVRSTIVYIINNCGRRMWIQVIIDYGIGSPCVSLGHGELWSHDYLWGSYRRTIVC